MLNCHPEEELSEDEALVESPEGADGAEGGALSAAPRAHHGALPEDDEHVDHHRRHRGQPQQVEQRVDRRRPEEQPEGK